MLSCGLSNIAHGEFLSNVKNVVHQKPHNVITLSHIKIDIIDRMIPIVSDF
jgi:hypothetical protein